MRGGIAQTTPTDHLITLGILAGIFGFTLLAIRKIGGA
jgi:hypothetical protein